MEDRCVLAVVVEFRGIAAAILSRVEPPADELFEDCCFVGDLLGDYGLQHLPQLSIFLIDGSTHPESLHSSSPWSWTARIDTLPL